MMLWKKIAITCRCVPPYEKPCPDTRDCSSFVALTVAPKMAMETKSDLQELAGKLNPTIGYFEPLGLVDGNFWGETDSATIAGCAFATHILRCVILAGFKKATAY